MIVGVSGPRKTSKSSKPDSLIQWVWLDFVVEKLKGLDLDLEMSIQVSAALSQRIAASEAPLEVLRWACMKGIPPYRAIGESSSYSKTSRLNRRYGSVYSPCPAEVDFKEN